MQNLQSVSSLPLIKFGTKIIILILKFVLHQFLGSYAYTRYVHEDVVRY